MALQSLGANKLRSGLTMFGITIGVFSVISVMTAIGALAKLNRERDQLPRLEYLPVRQISGERRPGRPEPGEIREPSQRHLRPGVALREPDGGHRARVCLKTFDFKGQSIYNGEKTHAGAHRGRFERKFSRREFLHPRLRPQHHGEDVDLARNVVLIGKAIEKTLFPHESPIGKVIKLSGHPSHVIGVLAEKGTAFGQSQDDICVIPITRFFENYGSTPSARQHRHAIVLAGDLQPHPGQGHRRDADRPRPQAESA